MIKLEAAANGLLFGIWNGSKSSFKNSVSESSGVTAKSNKNITFYFSWEYTPAATNDMGRIVT